MALKPAVRFAALVVVILGGALSACGDDTAASSNTTVTVETPVTQIESMKYSLVCGNLDAGAPAGNGMQLQFETKSKAQR